MRLALALTLALTGVAKAAPSGDPIWTARPSGEDVARVYPLEAWARKEAGQAVLVCRADAKGRLSPCRLLAMSDTSFGAGALKLGPLFRLRPTTSTGESVEGLVMVLPIQFTVDGSRSPDLVYALGSPAFLLVPGKGPESVACGTPDAPQTCIAHSLVWRQNVGLAESAPVVASLAAQPDSTLDCRVGPEGRLEDCTLTGQFTPEERARLLSLIAKLRAPDATRNGLPTAGGRIVAPLIWRALRQVATAYLKFAPQAADPP